MIEMDWPDREALHEGLAREVAARLAGALERRGAASLAVPGGTTPAPFLERLGQARLDWGRITVMPTDERIVTPGSERDNGAMIRRSLMRGPAAAARFLPFLGPMMVARPEHALPALVQEVDAALPLDVCVLGMGSDGHIASLFPGADRLDAALAPDAPPVMLLRAPGAPEPRLTLTAPVLRGAGALFVLITGADKRAALERARAPGPVGAAPVRLVLDRARVDWAP
ncbi:MAG: 6-phosphogluconolactonase [Alphaproteobacteria bacterium]|nr:MAG: 6-phosphogluconolactonase [Alphaproteobacteria bacterium]